MMDENQTATPHWFVGTTKNVKAWLKKETRGMIEDPGDVFREGPAVSLTPELDKLKEKWERGPVRDVRSVYNIPSKKWSHTGEYEVEAHNARVEKVFGEYPEELNPNWKPTNPKDLMGIRKVSFCCLPFNVLGEVALGMQEGGMKYGRHNYRDEGVAASTYVDAAIRHLAGFWEGEDIDAESGVHHISKAISTLVVLRDAMLNDKCTDDRPIKPINPDWLKDLNVEASVLVDKYPQPKNPYTHTPLPESRR